MKIYLFYLLLALITGALVPIQATTNVAFSKSIGSPSITGLMVFIIGLLATVLYTFLSGAPFPTGQQLASALIYGYLAGIIVALYVIMITILVPEIGVGTSIGI